MNRYVNSIAGRLSLRAPQRRSLEILDRLTEIAPPRKAADIAGALAAIQAEYPSVTDFERDFPSLCFALATGVGKTRLMGAFISYLHLAHSINNYFVLAPNLTIYNKLIADFTPNTPKYVFRGIAEFSTSPPEIITGDNYEQRAAVAQAALLSSVTVNIFNISKINSEVRGGKAPRIKRLSEYIGESYFDYLAALPDLVLIMDESHRYRASSGVRAINELKPVLGLELTATPFVETGKANVQFKNVIYDYPLGRAMADGFVKEPAVVTRENFSAAGMAPAELEQLKLEDGVRLHESVKVELETYARETGLPLVKPFLLVIARDTTHASELKTLIESDRFFDGRYAEKVIQVDSSRTGAEEDQMVERLLKVEHADEPTEIVVHVNMLKEGWDVTNLYTIVPLRAANARILIEQSIGRGLRLPYGKRTGVSAVDRLNIVAHDRFQEIIEEANRPDSPIRLQEIVLTGEQLHQKPVTVVGSSQLEARLGLGEQGPAAQPGSATVPIFSTAQEVGVARITREVIRRLENEPGHVPSLRYLLEPSRQSELVREVEAQWQPQQLGLEGVVAPPAFAEIVAKTVEAVVQQTIDIPRIVIVPKAAVRAGFKAFSLDLAPLNFPAPSDALWIKHLRTQQLEVLGLGPATQAEARDEDYVVSGLVDFDDVAYDEQADLLYDLAHQTVEHFRGYLKEDDARRVLQLHKREIARFIHAQMQEHYWEEPVDYEVTVTKGWDTLKESAFSAVTGDIPLDFRQAPADKSNMSRYLFVGFKRCLFSPVKFQSDPERRLAVILDRDSEKWFRPARGQFRIFYRLGSDHLEYQPDFVAETAAAIFLVECKAKGEMNEAEVVAKREAAVAWCGHASGYTATCGGKPWKYVLVPHDAVSENMTLEFLAQTYAC